MTVTTRPAKRLKRRRRVRAKISGTAVRPRISVFRSNRGISAQLVDDIAGHTLAAVSWTEADLRDKQSMEQATEAPLAIQKGVEQAKKNLFRVPKHGQTITHTTTGVYGAGRVFMKPASPGTGVIAGGGVRAVLELAGIHDILSKSLGSQNPINLVKATVAGLQGLRRPEEVAELRGLSIDEVLGLGGRELASETITADVEEPREEAVEAAAEATGPEEPSPAPPETVSDA